MNGEPNSQALLKAMLNDFGYESQSCYPLVDGLATTNHDVDLIILDAVSDEQTGVQIVQAILESDSFPGVPIIMVTASGGSQRSLGALHLGVDDFICEPIDQKELKIRVSALLKSKQAQNLAIHQDSEIEDQVARRTAFLEQENARLEQIAMTDALTGLCNHRSIVVTLMSEAERCLESNAQTTVLFLDLDHFKMLNDTCGHICGDSVLREFGGLLLKTVESSEFCGRWGGEEFVAILRNHDLAQGRTIAEEFRRMISQTTFHAIPHLPVTCSIGVACLPSDGPDLGTIVAAADGAMYMAKALGRNQVRTTEDANTGLILLLGNKSEKLDDSLQTVVDMLVKMVGMRDVYDTDHTDVVEVLAMQIATKMGLEDQELHLVRIVAKLHDIGKVGIPEAILQKDGPLTNEEWDIVRLHPLIGAQIIERIPSLSFVAPAILALNEHWDGSGYPNELVGSEIPLASLIVGVADAFSAMTADRPYKKGMSVQGGITEIESCSGSQFSPEVVQAFLKIASKDSSNNRAA